MHPPPASCVLLRRWELRFLQSSPQSPLTTSRRLLPNTTRQPHNPSSFIEHGTTVRACGAAHNEYSSFYLLRLKKQQRSVRWESKPFPLAPHNQASYPTPSEVPFLGRFVSFYTHTGRETFEFLRQRRQHGDHFRFLFSTLTSPPQPFLFKNLGANSFGIWEPSSAAKQKYIEVARTPCAWFSYAVQMHRYPLQTLSATLFVLT